MIFARKLLLRVFHNNKSSDIITDQPWKGATAQDLKNLKILSELFQENYSDHPPDTPVMPHQDRSRLPTYKIKSKNFQPMRLNVYAPFVREVLNIIEEMNTYDKSSTINLNRSQQRATIKELSDLSHIIIKPSDKGGNVMCYKILNNTSWYKRIPPQTVLFHNSDLLSLINMAKSQSIIDKATCEFLSHLPTNPNFLCTAEKS